MQPKKIITPRKLSGFMELPPYKQIVLDEMVDKIRKLYQSFGFMPLDTPILELSEILLAKSGGNIDKEIYNFKKGDTNICMRYDLTVPLARYVAMNSDSISFPFKRYQIGKAYRGERAQKGRFREFLQCDADIVGLEDLPLVADAECLILVNRVFDKLNLNVVNHISNRNILFGYCEDLGYKNITEDILIILDKIAKIGIDNVNFELNKLGVSQENSQKLIYLTNMCGPFDFILAKISNISNNVTFQKGISELKEISNYLNSFNLNKDTYLLDLSVIRGQNYYTGTVFEAIMPLHPEFGTICGGGRYDNLAGYYTDKKLPGVGLSIGLTRLFDLLDQNNLLPNLSPSILDLQIIPLGNTIEECLSLLNFFQRSLNCEINYENKSFKSKMKEANKKQIPYILIVGENEVHLKKYSLKDMDTGEQFSLSKEDCLNKILKK